MSFINVATRKLNDLIKRDDFEKIHSVRSAGKQFTGVVIVIEFTSGKVCTIDDHGKVIWFDEKPVF